MSLLLYTIDLLFFYYLSQDIVKVAVDMKTKISILRERGIIVNCPLEDPSVAKPLLPVNMIN